MLDFLKPYKLIIYGVMLITLLGMLGAGIHSYNSGLVEKGRNQVTAEWMAKSKARAEAEEKRRRQLESAKTVLSKQYNAELAARQNLQKQLDKERENAIRESAVASNICFDDRMLKSWNDAGGHAGTSGVGTAGRSVDAPVPADATKAGR